MQQSTHAQVKRIMHMNVIDAVFVFLLLVPTTVTIPIPNGVVGEPEIECGEGQIAISFQTMELFTGRVFVKGLSDRPECRFDASVAKPNNQRPTITLPIPSSPCNMKRERQVGSQSGIRFEVTIVISFHQKFITKVDKAYRIQCFYMETNKIVTQLLNVSMLATSLITYQFPMPICKYTVLNNDARFGALGVSVRYAQIGQKVIHEWSCEGGADKAYCMRVHTCFVDDGRGDRVTVINEHGCSIDQYLIQTPIEKAPLKHQVEAHVFKYADVAILQFQCQIALTQRNVGDSCPPVQCAGGNVRKPRSIDDEERIGEQDVLGEFSVLELDYVEPEKKELKFVQSQLHNNLDGGQFCLNNYAYRLLLLLMSITTVSVLLLVVLFAVKQNHSCNADDYKH